ncbi:MAG: polymerase [Bacteroidetes bacterium]|jgi:RNA polymerase sigma-70 factor, ECF subfamily|nr:polymerase [Bacteroidota bacterium]
MLFNRELEVELVNQLNQGSQTAFSHLFSLYRKQVFYYCLHFVKDTELAEDITQDIFMNIWEKRKSIKSEYPFLAFLYTVTRHRICDILRSANTQSLIYQSLLKKAVDYTEEVEQKIEEKEMQEALRNAMGKLTPRQKEVFKLSRIEGLSNKEIAKKLGISVFTVQDHIKASLETIRTYLLENADLVGIILLLHFIDLNTNVC